MKPAAGERGPATDPSDFPSEGPDSLATIGERAVAKLIDLAILSIPSAVLVLPFIGQEDGEVRFDQPVWAWGAIIALVVLYDTVAVARWGCTVGKRVFSLRVARLADGRTPDAHQSAIRALVPAAVVVLPVVGVLVVVVFARALLDPLRQGLHDRAAGTVVVRAR